MSLIQRYNELGERFNPADVSIKSSLRVNTLKIQEKELISRLTKKKVKLEKIPFVDNGYYYRSNFSLGATPEYLQGYYYLQEGASQLPVKALDPKPNEKVLDMAAAPGSKTTQMAQFMQNKGTIVALDTNIKRLETLRNNLERLSVTNTLIYKKDARFADDLGIKFDKVLLDAPCSGNFCIEKEFFKKRNVQDFKLKAKTQKELLRAAVKVLKKGGVLVYSTCSLEPEEDEEVIDWLLKKYPEMKPEDTGLNVGDEGLTEIFEKQLNPKIKMTRRLWPHKTGTQGFFIAKLVKK